ncbi:MAG: hypothetical protein ACFFE4_05790 [Candidatus Thorarchaeota archaeon]
MNEIKFIDQDESNKSKLFGFKINNMVAALLFYMILPFLLNSIPMIVYQTLNLRHVSIAELLGNFQSVLYFALYLVLPVNLIPLYVYVLIKCVIIQKNSRENTNTSVRWLGFQLTKSSLFIIFFMSILNLILSFRSWVSASMNLPFFLDRPFYYPEIIAQYIAMIIIGIFLMVFFIYSLVVCVKNRNVIR